MPFDETIEWPSAEDEDRKGSKEAIKAGRLLNERLRGVDSKLHSEFGLCAKCRHFRIVTKASGAYLDKYAWCNELPTRMEQLSSDRPVKDCSIYWPIGAPTLREMIAEASALEKRDLVRGYL